MKIQVRTLFDCSTTGTTGHFRAAQLPYRDRANNSIVDYASWTRSRNRQRNWETLLQIIGLRSQLDNIQPSEFRDGAWHFSFEVHNVAVFGGDLDLLLQDCEGVPMVTNLDQATPTAATLITTGQHQNIWFQTVNI